MYRVFERGRRQDLPRRLQALTRQPVLDLVFVVIVTSIVEVEEFGEKGFGC